MVIAQSDYRPLILECLRRHGGTASKQEVVTWIEAQIGESFDEGDLALRDTRDEAVWSSRASYERRAMVDDGLLERRQDNVWQLTAAGGALAEAAAPAAPVAARRNPNWAADELILAMDLYVRSGLLDDTHPELVELSRVLNALPIHPDRPDAGRFRNANGVALKLANFAALDPDYPGVGIARGGRRDAEIWDRYTTDRETLEAIAAQLRAGAETGIFTGSPVEDEDEVQEGRLLFRRHRARERSRGIVERKKSMTIARDGTLVCEVCSFDYSVAYGPLGDGYMECHHRVPLSEAEARTTRQSDLALVCANCHRMIHRRSPWLSVEELRGLIEPR